MRAASSRATVLATLVIMTMPSLLPACVQATPEAKKMRPPHVPLSSHRLRIGCVLGAGFDRRLLALRKVPARRLRPAGRLTCRVHGQNRRRRDRRAWIRLLSLESSPSNLTRLQKALRVGSKLALRRCVFTALPLSTRCTQSSAEHTSALLPDTMNAHQQDTWSTWSAVCSLMYPGSVTPRASPTPTMHQMPPLPLPLRSVASVATLCFPSHASQHVLVQLTSKSQSSRCPRR